MSDSARCLPARPSLEQLRKQAKELLKKQRASGRPTSLADAQFALAREYGFDNWASLKRHIESVRPSRIETYQKLAEDVVQACRTGDPAAVERIGEFFGARLTAESVKNRVALRLNTPNRPTVAVESISLLDAQIFVARLYGFSDWVAFEASIVQSPAKSTPSVHGLSATPPFYKIDRKNDSIQPLPPLSLEDWDEIFDAMRQHRVTGLHANSQMTDAALERLAQLDLATSLQLEGCRRVTDQGLRHLGRMSRLDSLNLSGCSITDKGLAVLRELTALREFYLYHHRGVSDAGLAKLEFCDQLERVDLLGSTAGDGVIRALACKPKLRHFKSGTQVTDAGLPLLHEFPVFKRWQGGEPKFSLMSFGAEPNHLLLRGQITDQGLAALAGLDGLFSLNLDDSQLDITASGLKTLASLPNLCFLGFDATDETMGTIAEMPRLRMLMCQDTRAGDAGFTALSRSRTLEYIWGRRCYNLAGAGFRAMAQMPSLRGLSVSCRNVGDDSLSALPDFPALVEFMPMDVPDDGFRHVGRCKQLEAVWCMYCRDTGDVATSHLSELQHLKTYYAGQTRITDRSLEILSKMQSLERVMLSACAGVTNAGIAGLARLPRLQELTLELLQGVTREAVMSVPAHVRVNFEY